MNDALFSMWRIWDTIYFHCTRLIYVDKENGNIFRIVVKKYKGQPLKVRDKVIIGPGDDYVKIHIHNYRLASCLRGITDDVGLGIKALKEVRQSLPALAKAIAELPNVERIKGIVGTTILHRGSARLGFHVQEIQSPIYRTFKTWFFLFILALCHPQGYRRIQRKKNTLIAKRLFMSKEELFQRYLVR